MEKIATEEEVWLVCKRFDDENQRISGNSVQRETGGSKATVLRYIKTYRAERLKSLPGFDNIPPEAQNHILRAFTISVQTETEKLTLEKNESSQREDEAVEALGQSEKEISALKNKLDDALKQLTDVQQQKEKQAVVTAETEAGLRDQLDKLSHENNELIHARETANIKAAKMQLLQERAELDATKSEEKVLELEKRATALEKAKAEAEKANAVTERHAQYLSDQLKIAEAALEKIESEKAELTGALNAVESVCRKAEGTAEQMALRILDSAAANDQLNSELQSVRKETALVVEQMTIHIRESEVAVTQLRRDLEATKKEVIAAKLMAAAPGNPVKSVLPVSFSQLSDNHHHQNVEQYAE